MNNEFLHITPQSLAQSHMLIVSNNKFLKYIIMNKQCHYRGKNKGIIITLQKYLLVMCV